MSAALMKSTVAYGFSSSYASMRVRARAQAHVHVRADLVEAFVERDLALVEESLLSRCSPMACCHLVSCVCMHADELGF